MDPREGAAACSRARQRGFVIRRIGLRRFVPPLRGRYIRPAARGLVSSPPDLATDRLQEHGTRFAL